MQQTTSQNKKKQKKKKKKEKKKSHHHSFRVRIHGPFRHYTELIQMRQPEIFPLQLTFAAREAKIHICIIFARRKRF
jgi:hypothetical protein